MRERESSNLSTVIIQFKFHLVHLCHPPSPPPHHPASLNHPSTSLYNYFFHHFLLLFLLLSLFHRPSSILGLFVPFPFCLFVPLPLRCRCLVLPVAIIIISNTSNTYLSRLSPLTTPTTLFNITGFSPHTLLSLPMFCYRRIFSRWRGKLFDIIPIT